MTDVEPAPDGAVADGAVGGGRASSLRIDRLLLIAGTLLMPLAFATMSVAGFFWHRANQAQQNAAAIASQIGQGGGLYYVVRQRAESHAKTATVLFLLGLMTVAAGSGMLFVGFQKKREADELAADEQLD